jgi:serine-type D-Ala-D-Ala carboxypeptidase/endopeptidase
LDDPVQTFLPPEVQVPREGTREITLIDLATHRSGLPRLPPNLASGSDPKDPYAHITTERFYEELAVTELVSPIGSEVLYSNFGFGLLGHALELTAGVAFADLLRERVTSRSG